MSGIERVVVIHDFSKPEGGAGILTAECIRQYVSHGLPVTFLTGEASTPELEDLNVDVVGLNSKPLLDISALEALRQGYHNGAALDLVRNWIAAHDTPGTVYHVHNWSQMLSPSIFIALKTVAERTIVTCHDFFNVCPNGAFMNFRKTLPCDLKPGSMGCLMSACDRRSHLHKIWRFARQRHLNEVSEFGARPFMFTFIHDRMKERFEQAGFPRSDGETIPNPVRPWTTERIEAENNSGFLFVGRVSGDKGADLALAATTKIGETLTVIGEGELSQDGSAFYPQANFVGWKQPSEIAEIARQCRALIVPSRVNEPFGLVILEAAMSGLPVIVTRRAALADDVERLGFGERFAIRSADQLPSVIKKFASDDDLIKTMSHAGFEHAGELCHTPESWIDAHIAKFETRLVELVAA
ncbi:MAG: glycosyltransferase family 4 protein [Pseudomonadota bacterium]